MCFFHPKFDFQKSFWISRPCASFSVSLPSSCPKQTKGKASGRSSHSRCPSQSGQHTPALTLKDDISAVNPAALTCPPEATLDLVKDQQGSCLVTELPEALQEGQLPGGDAALALHRLHKDSGGDALLDELWGGKGEIGMDA